MLLKCPSLEGDYLPARHCPCTSSARGRALQRPWWCARAWSAAVAVVGGGGGEVYIGRHRPTAYACGDVCRLSILLL